MTTLPLALPAPRRAGARDLRALLVVLALVVGASVAVAPVRQAVDRLAGPQVREAGRDGPLAVDGASYTSTFDDRGFAYRPSRDAGPLARISTTSLVRGDRALPLDPGTWTGDGSVAERPLGDGVQERVTVSGTGIEWDVVLAERPAGAGDLTVRARLSGIVGTVVRPGADTIGLRLGDGRVVDMGELIVVDATGAELLRQLPKVTGDLIELVVPSRVLDRAVYPLVLDPKFRGGLLMNDNWDNSGSPSLAYNGSKTLAVWRKFGQIQGSLMAPDTSSRQPTFVISSITGSQHTPDVAWNGSSFLVTWARQVTQGNYDIYAQRVSATGTLVGGLITVSSLSVMQMTPAVAAGPGGTFLVVWDDSRNSSSGLARDTYGQRITSSGVPQDGTGFRISNDTSGTRTNDVKPDVSASSSTFFVVWEAVGMAGVTYKSIIGATVPVSGANVVRSVATNADPSKTVEDPAVAFDGTSFAVIYEDARGPADADTDLAGTTVTGAGVPTGRYVISDAPGHQDIPAIAFSGHRYLVAWIDRRNDPNGDVYAAQVEADLQISAPFFVNDTYQTSAVVAISPAPPNPDDMDSWTSYTIAWQDQPEDYGTGVLAFGVTVGMK